MPETPDVVWYCRYVPKNHSRSRLIGPPSDALASYALLIPGPRVMPLLRRSSSMLSPRDQSPAVLKNAWPENLLPPDLGTRFIVGPPVSFSPSAPETSITASSRLFVSEVSDETAPPVNAAATG